MLSYIFSVRLWEANVTNRQSLVEPFVSLTSRITQPQSKLCVYNHKESSETENIWKLYYFIHDVNPGGGLAQWVARLTCYWSVMSQTQSKATIVSLAKKL